jgi:hypothetical protein
VQETIAEDAVDARLRGLLDAGWHVRELRR